MAEKRAADMPLGKLLVLVGVQAALFTGLGLALWWFSGRAFNGFVSSSADEWFVGVLLGTALIAIAAIAFYGFPRITDILVRLQGKSYTFLENPLPMWAIVWISICAGVGEEALFRGGLQVFLGDYMGPFAAIAISSIVFALVHMAKPVVAAIILVIGVLFGVIYWQTGSLLTVMLGHAIYDVFALAYLQRRLHQIGFFTEEPAE